MALQLPEKISEHYLAVLSLVAQQGPITKPQIADMLPQFKTGSAVAAMTGKEYLKSVKIPGKPLVHYQTTKLGAAIIDNLESIAVVTRPEHEMLTDEVAPKATRAKPPGAVKKRSSVDTSFSIQPVQVPLNLSVSADSLMDQISSVIQENAHYREALHKAASQIAGYIGMKLVPAHFEAFPPQALAADDDQTGPDAD